MPCVSGLFPLSTEDPDPLATDGMVEDRPGGEILRKSFETVCCTGRDEQRFPGFEIVSLVSGTLLPGRSIDGADGVLRHT